MTTGRVLELFDVLCDAAPAAVDAALSDESDSVRRRVLKMLAADADDAIEPCDAAVTEALAIDLIVEISGVSGRWRPPGAVPGFDVEEELGRGAMGIVFAARQHEPARDVAIKFMEPGTSVLEGHMLARLRHRCIPVVFAIGRVESFPYLCMERVRGLPLMGWCAVRSLREKLEVFADICAAVEHAHQAGVLHRDIKPSNVLVDEGHPWVLDFGLANHEDTERPELAGTYAYLATECLGGEPATRRTDVFSLAVTLTEMLGARATRQSLGVHGQRLARRQHPPETWDAHEDPAIVAIVQRGLSPVESRYASASELEADIRRWLAGVDPSVYSPHLTERIRRFTRRHRRVGVFGVVAAVMVLAALYNARVREQARRQLEAGAQSTVDAQRGPILEKVHDGDLSGAAAAMQAVLDVPAVAGTAVRAKEQAWFGEIIVGLDPEASIPWFARAIAGGIEGEDRARTIEQLAGALEATSAWSGLRLLADQMEGESRVRALASAAIGLRDLSDASVPSHWSFLAQAEPLGFRPTSAAVNAGRVTLINTVDGMGMVGDATDREGFILPAELANEAVLFASYQDQLYAVGSHVDGGAGIWAVSKTWESRGRLPNVKRPVAVGGFEASPWIVVGTEWPEYAIVGFDPRTREWTRNLPGLSHGESDILGLHPHGDDLFLLQGAWVDYDLKHLRFDGERFALVGRTRLGASTLGALVDRPDGAWLAIQKVDSWPRAEVLGESHPHGIPEGLYFLDVDASPPRLVERLPLLGRGTHQPSVTGDFDGNGFDDFAFRVSEGDTVFTLMDADGVLDRRVANLQVLAAGNLDADPAAEVVVRLRDQNELAWIVGVGDGSLPPRPYASRDVDMASTSSGAGLLLELGLVGDALEMLVNETRGEGGVDRQRRLRRVADLAMLPDIAQFDVAQSALETLRDLGAPVDAELEHLRHGRHLDLFDDASALDLTRELPPAHIVDPLALRWTTEGLRVRAIGAEGELMALPVRATDGQTALQLAFTIHKAERGANLHVELEDASGRVVLGVEMRPFGGAGRVSRGVHCTGPPNNLGTFGALESEQREAAALARASYRDGHLLCAVEVGEVRSEHSSDAPSEAGPPTRLVVRTSHAEGHSNQLVDVTLTSISLRGARLARMPASPAWRMVRGAVDFDALDPDFADAVRVRRGEVELALDVLQRLETPVAHGEIRRAPLAWLAGLGTHPRQLAEHYVPAWTEVHRSGSADDVEAALEHPGIDWLPLDVPGVPRMLVHRADALRRWGQAERSVRILERLRDDDRRTPEIELRYVQGLVALKRFEDASEACQTLDLEASEIRDRMAWLPETWEACGRPELDAFLVPL